MTDADCPVCGHEMVEGELDGNWREYHCSDCDLDVLRAAASDHGDGFTVEDLSNAASFSTNSTSSDTGDSS